MTIGIDISMLVYQGSGVATYTYNFVKSLLKYNKENKYKLFYSSLRRTKRTKAILQEFRKLGGEVYDFRFPPRVLKFLWNKNHLLPVELLIGKVDWYHSSDFLRPPLLKGTRGITTVHDLTWKVHPEFHTKQIVRAHVKKMAKTLKYDDLIIVDSNSTKQDLFKYYPETELKRVVVIPLGIDDRFRPINSQKLIAKILSKYNIAYPRRYLLYVGAIEPRKNLDTAVHVFSRLIENPEYSDFEFLIVGRAGWKNEDLFKLVDDLNLDEEIHFVGYVDDEDLPYFYNAAQVFIYLSEYEGFGLPPMEAAACGIPTLLYKNSSLGELFNKSYRFTQNGNELDTLLKLLDQNINVETNAVTWKTYIHEFNNSLKN